MAAFSQAGSPGSPGRDVEDFEGRIAALPIWRGARKIEPLSGGLSNVSFAVTDASGKYVVRSSEEAPFHGVSRTREQTVARAAHALGFAPELVHAEPGLMVSRFVEGRTLTAQDIRERVIEIAAFLRRFHNDLAEALGQPGRFCIFTAIRSYAGALGNEGGAMTERMREYLNVAEELQAAQVLLPERIGHNDLLAANFIEDGERIWLIDFEYAGTSAPMFDLGNLSSNAQFSSEQSEALLEAYFGRTPDAGLRRSLSAMECASLLREALWALVSDRHLNAPGADYVGYAELNFDRFRAALQRHRVMWG